MTTEIIEQTKEDKLSPISKFESEITRMQKEFASLIIKDVNDKVGFANVSAARKEAKALRVNIEKGRKMLNEDALAWQKQVNEKAKILTAEILPIEHRLEKMEIDYEEEKERIKQEAARVAKARIANRALVITSIDGVKFNGVYYTLETASLSQSQLEDLNDSDFQTKVEEFEAAYQVVLAARIEAERIAKEESDRIEAQRIANEAAAAELQGIAEEQAETAKNLKAQQDLIDAERAKLEKSKEEVVVIPGAEHAPMTATVVIKEEVSPAQPPVRIMSHGPVVNPDIEKFEDMKAKITAIVASFEFKTEEGKAAQKDFQLFISTINIK